MNLTYSFSALFLTLVSRFKYQFKGTSLGEPRDKVSATVATFGIKPVFKLTVGRRNALWFSTMNIKLVSKDSELCQLCREIVAELPGQASVLSAAEYSGNESADLYIWDFQPNRSIPERLDQGHSKHLFIVHRKDLASFQKKNVAAEANILLKPVTRATLATFLGLAVSSGAANSLRVDRDEILQCLIQTNLRLQEYDHDRTNFLARAVHDFRAPLTALSGYCGLLLGEPLGTINENQREVLQRMQNSARRLSRMASAMFQ